jgi:hypothetical protein
MPQTRDEFRRFLLRIASNDVRADDWNTFAVQHYCDEEVESLRKRLVEQSLAFPDWQVGWIPRGLQDIAQGLAEYLRDYPEDSITYWPEWSEFTEDGTLKIKVTWFDAEAHSTGRCEIPKGHDDYRCWCWAEDHRRKGLKRQDDIQRLRLEYRNQL